MRPVPALAVTAALLVALAGCSGDSNDSSGGPDGDPAASGATEVPPLVTTVTNGKLVGTLAKDKRQRAREQVAATVDAWFDAAYVGGDYPRSDFSTSWPGFTPGARADAKKDKALMSNQDLGAEISGVEATARKVTVDILAAKGHAVGATARVVLEFTTEGDVERDVEVRGRLFLTPTPEGWQIFGYDIGKGGAA